MAPTPTFFWYDLETSGVDPRWHRIVQFAGVRTNLALDEIGSPVSEYVRLPIDVLPEPEACLITGVTPQLVNAKGLPELEAHVLIDRELSKPGTCAVGFNNLRFDDEFVRYGLYRHLLDPYAREWRGGNSRWDLIDLIRATAALRPEGMEWPLEAGLPVFNLEALSRANHVEHANAHDALADVRATLGLARLVRKCQPKLFDYYLSLRDKSRVRGLLSVDDPRIRLHVSGMLGRERWNVAPVVAVAKHPTNSNSVIVVDLGRDVEGLLHDDAEQIREKLFSRGDHERPPLKEVRLNRAPFVAPLAVLRSEDRQRLAFDLAASQRRFERLKSAAGIEEKIQRVFLREESRKEAREEARAEADPDAALYDGFFADADRERGRIVVARLLANEDIATVKFTDRRMEALAWRLRARRSFADLDPLSRDRWRKEVAARLSDAQSGLSGPVTLQRFQDETRAAMKAGQSPVLDQLIAHQASVERWLRGD